MTDLLDNEDANQDAMKQKQIKYALQFEREKTVLKYYLLGKGYHLAIKALGFIERIDARLPEEKRLRKDKATPNLHHQVRIALAVTQLKGIVDEEKCIIAALLHDVQEDHNVSPAEITKEFGAEIAEINWKLTKKYAGTTKNKEEYIREIALCIICSIVKGLDRNDNLFCMVDAFNLDKMLQYAGEAEEIFLKMIKTASKYFPEQLQAYNTISIQMKRQIAATRQYVSVAKQAESLEHEFDSVVEFSTEQGQKIKDLEEKLAAAVKSNHNTDEAQKLFFTFASVVMNKKYNVPKDEVPKMLSDLSIALGISTLELVQYTNDALSADAIRYPTIELPPR